MKTNLTFSRKWKGQSEVPRAPEGGRQTSCEGREGPEAQTFTLPSGGGQLTLLGRGGAGSFGFGEIKAVVRSRQVESRGLDHAGGAR